MDHKVKKFKIVGSVGIFLWGVTKKYCFTNMGSELVQIIWDNSGV